MGSRNNVDQEKAAIKALKTQTIVLSLGPLPTMRFENERASLRPQYHSCRRQLDTPFLREAYTYSRRPTPLLTTNVD